jgi:hypothetical protein
VMALPWYGRERSGDVFRLCLDLNVWCAATIAEGFGRSGTAVLTLAAAAHSGRCELGPTQLVVSWGMLDRLGLVLRRELGMEVDEAGAVLARIKTAAELGPAAMEPLVVLGGTGVLAIRDTEDLHVLDAAVAGRADVLATANLRDFVNYRSEVLVPGRVVLHRTADHEVVIAHPGEVARWVRTGEIRIG